MAVVPPTMSWGSSTTSWPRPRFLPSVRADHIVGHDDGAGVRMRVSAPQSTGARNRPEGVFGATAGTSDLEVSRFDATNQVAAIDPVRRSIATETRSC